jgi:methionyl-tRNA synthetase
MSKFYVTAAIPYVNAKPHVGHALEFVQTDVIRRFHTLQGKETLMLSGGDENAIKNVQAAEKSGKPLQQFIDDNTKAFEELAERLSINFDVFQKGSAQNHHESSKALWELCNKNGDIYKKSYTGLYCVGCELFYEKSELNENGECFEHPGKALEEVTEENYFFKLSKYQKQIEELLESNTLQIIPKVRKNEALSFVRQGLQDISISRSNERARNWGVTVPEDESQKMYVWFDALNIYQSGVGFGSDEALYKKWWPADIHVIGKGILRFHAVYWPAFLLSAGLSVPKSLFVHGYFTVDGQKMSKSLGNVIDPIEMIEKYGVDALRYYFLREIPATADGDFSERRLIELYNADLANGLGNLVARIAKLCEKVGLETTDKPTALTPQVEKLLSEYKFNEALAEIWKQITTADKYVNETKPWTLEADVLEKVLQKLVRQIQQIAFDLQSFLPTTSEKILEQFNGKIISTTPLFPRSVKIYKQKESLYNKKAPPASETFLCITFRTPERFISISILIS